jgi:hypothetical protein
LAVDELSNRLEVLVALPVEEAETAIHDIENDGLPAQLVGAKIEGAIRHEDYGRRVSLTLTWPAEVKLRPEVSLSAWSFVEDDTQEERP